MVQPRVARSDRLVPIGADGRGVIDFISTLFDFCAVNQTRDRLKITLECLKISAD
jgi:hypothetical protein